MRERFYIDVDQFGQVLRLKKNLLHKTYDPLRNTFINRLIKHLVVKGDGLIVDKGQNITLTL